MARVNLQELIKQISYHAFKEALLTVTKYHEEFTDRDIRMMLGLTKFEFDRFINQSLPRAYTKQVQNKILETLERGDSINIPSQLTVYVHESETRKNPDGTAIRKLSIRTREEMMNRLNKRLKKDN